MLRLAIGGHTAIVAWDVELKRGGVSYTVDTLRTLNEERPNDELFFLMGGDSLYDLPNWREPAEICRLASVAVVDRPGSKPVDYEVLNEFVSEERRREFRELRVEMPQIDLSSTEIRRRVAEGRSIRFQTPRAVEQYIANAGLYRGSQS